MYTRNLVIGLLLFLALKGCDIVLFLVLRDSIPWYVFFGDILITGIVGILIIWRLPLRHWCAISMILWGFLTEYKIVKEDAYHGFLLLLAGILLIMPGLLADFMGALILLPPVRSLVMAKFVK
jgi:UPF0716 protein FxsA